MCDIGQGDAVLLRSEGATMLVDTGPDPALLDACLTRLGIGRLDVLVLTHFDLDHVGGVDAAAGRADTVLHGPLGEDGEEWLERAGKARRTDASVGMSGSLGAARWRVLWPRRDSRAFPEGNDASVVLAIAGGAIPRTLLLGDLGASSQAALRGSGALAGRFDVVKVAHHGSADQDPELYRMARPALALIGVGADNDYGHPAAGILAELRSLGTTTARTDEDGLVLIGRSAHGAPWVWRERPATQKVAG
ncbi:MBL fold metallo-hydrolase [Microbacterium oryzae]|uniref:ComEC/Rec2 family competence protein n=1 Tax=Microbacterium oryzae TaxID=743009 RepID=UPI0025B13FEE|nr:MBL fold metallo-hydrolase [Microbacterium oryzae]MDN3311756.1 MBL fold metallo-hydrolase [Microbacterium oryzae]